ncbi:MAG: helix-hairpin-helix domain-containing protein [Chitinophagaceae bacterium]|jgi:competence protein ComEA|nr:helix-hairpin-helix domain-containing protein [Chitinophagaceae bacterium]
MQFTQRKWIRDYFTFSQKERRSVIVLVILAVFFALFPALFPFLVKDEIELVVDTVTQNQLAQLQIIPERKEYNRQEEGTEQWYQPKSSNTYQTQSKTTAAELFYFNPNTASAADFERLGLRVKTIQTIINYRSKGGRFYKADDLERIYGLRHEEFERLFPYVQIEQPTTEKNTATVFEPSQTKKTEPKVFLIDINTADTTEWKKLNGIGSKLSQRIVNFRTKLGGFVSAEQVSETFGLPDSTFQKIKPQLQFNSASIKTFNLNTATVDELKTHPYIKYSIANAIVQYRNEHGPYKTVADLQKLDAVDETLFKKIAPYLVTGE